MNAKKKKWDDPKVIFEQYKRGVTYKESLGERSMYEQNRINERFYVGDQWHGAQCGADRPLIRYNVIKRIGDFKMAMAAGSELTVNFSAEGVAYTKEMADRVAQRKEQYRLATGDPTANPGAGAPDDEKINLVMDALSEYFKVTAERVKFEDLKNTALRKAYTSGSGVLYTYWDDTVRTGQFADAGKNNPIWGDIQCEVLDIENIYLGDTAEPDVQKQPYIIIAMRRSVEDLKREARRHGRPADELEKIQPDKDTEFLAGDIREKEPAEEQKATVLTKLYKKYNKDGTQYSIHAVRVVEGAVIRPAWDINVRLYPLAKIDWERVPNCAYGLSEVTQLVPNQIAINRAQTAAAHAVMTAGMPILLVNGDVVTEPITNDPGQIIRIYGDLTNAIRFEGPSNFSPQFDNLVNSMIANTLTQSGANDAALGDMRPDNTSAFIAVREAATVPLQLIKSRFYSFVEDVARVWAEFWVCMYGPRRLKMEDEGGVWYMPFNGEEYKDVLINARVDVGPANLWSEIQMLQTLDKLLQAGILTPEQYLNNLPKGSIPNQTAILKELKEKQAAQPPATTPEGAGAPATLGIEQILAQMPEEYRQKIAGMSPEQQAQLAQQLGAM